MVRSALRIASGRERSRAAAVRLPLARVGFAFGGEDLGLATGDKIGSHSRRNRRTRDEASEMAGNVDAVQLRITLVDEYGADRAQRARGERRAAARICATFRKPGRVP